MKLFLPLLCILSGSLRAQFPFVEMLPATDTETTAPTFSAYVSANADYGVAFFQMGTDSMDLNDCSLALILSNPDTVLLVRQVDADCDSFYFYQAFVMNDFHSIASPIFSFSAPTCASIEEVNSSRLIITIVPDPITSVSKILAPRETHIEIYDLLGRRKNVVTINNVTCVYRKDFTSGIYVLHASYHGDEATIKFLVE